MGPWRAAGRGGARARLRLRPPRRDQAHSRGRRSAADRRTHGARPQPGQLLCRDRTGRVPRRQRRAGDRLHQRPVDAGSPVLLPRHPAHPAGWPELRAAAGQPADRRSSPPPAGRLRPAPSRRLARFVSPELDRRRVPGTRLGRGWRLPPLPGARQRHDDPQAERQLQGSLQPGDAVLELDERLGAAAHRGRAPVRAREGRARIHPRTHDRAARARGPSVWRARSPKGSGSTRRRRRSRTTDGAPRH